MDSKSLKDLLGADAENIIVNGLSIQKYNQTTHVGLCPLHNEKSPSFSWSKKDNNFKCFGCGQTYDIFDFYQQAHKLSFLEAKKKVAELVNVTLHEDYNVKVKKEAYKEEFITPEASGKTPSDLMIEYFKGRALEKDTLEFWRVGEDIKTIQGKSRKVIVFPCYDEDGDLMHETYRTSDKKFLQSVKTKSILYGMWHVNPTKTLYITEGQLDAMSVWQAGVKNVVSVPSGANNYKFIEHCFDFLSQFDDIVLWADNDEAGRKLASVLKSKLESVSVKYHSKYKDANECLIAEGSGEIVEFLNSEPELPKGIKKLEHLHYTSEPIGDDQRIETGFREYDEHIDDWRTQQLSIVFGRDNEGKSTFISQVIVHQLISKKKTFLYSAELGEQGLQDWLFRQLIGSNHGCYVKKKSKYADEYFIKPEVIEAILKWGKDTLYLVDRMDDDITKGQDDLFISMKQLATKHNVKLFVIDNLQAVLQENGDRIFSDQSNFVERCRRFAYNYDCHVVLVAHPRKVYELDSSKSEPLMGNLTKDDISGSKNISNKAHNVISVERDFDANYFDMIITDLKDKKHGVRRGFKYYFDKKTYRFYNEVTKAEVKADWIDYLPDGALENMKEQDIQEQLNTPWTQLSTEDPF